MEKKYFAPSELIINEDGSIFHLHLKPGNLADKVKWKAVSSEQLQEPITANASRL